MELLELRWMQGLSTAEIGCLMGRSEDAIRKLHGRAMETLREHLKAT